jgi:hypothetical protein
VLVEGTEADPFPLQQMVVGVLVPKYHEKKDINL